MRSPRLGAHATACERLSAPPRRWRIAEAAVLVARRHETTLLVYGDCGLLDEIGALAQMTPTHPLNRHARILDALGRSPLWERRWGRWGTTQRLVRGFELSAAGRAAEFPEDVAGRQPRSSPAARCRRALPPRARANPLIV